MLVRQTIFDELLEELEKCVLVCSNCHNEIEGGLVDLELLVELGER